MNDIAAIKARREAITLDGWTSGWVDREMESGATCAWAEGPDHIDDDWDSATKLAAKDAAFIAAAPADIDTLLAEVERLTGERNGLAEMFTAQLAKCYRLENEVAALTAERDERSLVAEQLSMVLHIRDTQLAALTAERDALAQQLQQAQAQLAGDVVEPMLWKAAPPKRHEWDEDATTPA